MGKSQQLCLELIVAFFVAIELEFFRFVEHYKVKLNKNAYNAFNMINLRVLCY